MSFNITFAYSPKFTVPEIQEGIDKSEFVKYEKELGKNTEVEKFIKKEKNGTLEEYIRRVVKKVYFCKKSI